VNAEAFIELEGEVEDVRVRMDAETVIELVQSQNAEIADSDESDSDEPVVCSITSQQALFNGI
jgi:hypothetical protein